LEFALQAAAAQAVDSLAGTSVYLVGMMGSGKSTVGKMMSQALGYCFFDSDQLIEQLAGKPVPDIFAEDGEEEFRSVETRVLQELAPFKDCVVSTGGGAATRGVNWGHMQGGIVVWLNGPPRLLAQRVLADGTAGRPLLADAAGGDGDELERTVARLAALLEERRQQYGAADLVVSLEGDTPATADLGAPAALVVLRVLLAINERVAKDAAMRAERQNFEVVNEAKPATMRVVKSINDAPGAEADPFLP
jgi:shikimate kinase